jgi:hypothetical protein
VINFKLRPLFTLGMIHDAHWIGGWVGPRAALDAVAKRKIPDSATFLVMEKQTILGSDPVKNFNRNTWLCFVKFTKLNSASSMDGSQTHSSSAAQTTAVTVLSAGSEFLLFRFLSGLGIFLFTTASRTALGPTQPPIQWVPGALSLGVKRPGHEADHSPPSSAEVKDEWSCTSTLLYVFMAWCLIKHRDNFTLIFFNWLLQSLSDLGLP